MVSRRLSFSLLVSLALGGLFFLVEPDYEFDYRHSFLASSDEGTLLARKTGDLTETYGTSSKSAEGSALVMGVGANITSNTTGSHRRSQISSHPHSNYTKQISPILRKIRKRLSSLVELKDAIQIFHRRVEPNDFRFISTKHCRDLTANHSTSFENMCLPSTSQWALPTANHSALSATFEPRPQRCALVGNSGVLRNSGCGKAIDAHDFVMRMNLAPIGGAYAKDVGAKISITTMNREQMLLAVQCAMNHTDDIDKECADLTTRIRQADDGIVWYTKGGYQGRMNVMANEFQRHLTRSGHRHAPRWAYSPVVMEGVCRKAWNTKNPSTGLIAFTLASIFCNEISLYGFYPFQKDALNRSLSYHYYEAEESQLHEYFNKHQMPREFKIFQRFAEKGSPNNRLITTHCMRN